MRNAVICMICDAQIALQVFCEDCIDDKNIKRSICHLMGLNDHRWGYHLVNLEPNIYIHVAFTFKVQRKKCNLVIAS